VLTLPPSVRVHLAVQPIDIRKSFDGLSGAVRDVLAEDPLSGHLFVFRNKRGDMVKVLWWSRGGFSIFYKRLERGTFHLPRRVSATTTAVTVDTAELALMLEGIELPSARRLPRWTPPQRAGKATL
jgi:transposase